MRRPISVLITDLDNTLYDWLRMWHRAFSTLLDQVVLQSGISREILIAEIRSVHREHGTSEYAFLLQELPSLRWLHPGIEPAEIPQLYRGAIEAYREARRAELRLYPGVKETLAQVKKRGTLVIGHTESRAFYTSYRIRRLGLDGLLDSVFSPADHGVPAISLDEVRSYPPAEYELKDTHHVLLPEGLHKPDPQALQLILSQIGTEPASAIYVGDSLARDVQMAQAAGVADVYARYGDPVRRPEYDLLRQVTRWSDEQVASERRLHVSEPSPSYTLNLGFTQLFELFSFEACPKPPL